MGGRYDNVELAQHLIGQIQGAVFQNVDLHPTQNPKWLIWFCQWLFCFLGRKSLIDGLDLCQLLAQSLFGKSVSNGEASRVVGEDEIGVSEISCRQCHCQD